MWAFEKAILRPTFVMQTLHQGDSAAGMAAHPVQELRGTPGPRKTGGGQSPSGRSLRAAQRHVRCAARRRRRVAGAGRGATQTGGVYSAQKGLKVVCQELLCVYVMHTGQADTHRRMV